MPSAVMNIGPPVLVKDQMEMNLFTEVANTERHLWASIHSKGLLHPDILDLYRKARTAYEKIILNDREVVEIQDVEFSLWKLHYKHIDEYRKRIRPASGNAESTKSATPQDIASVRSSIYDHMERFKSFLSEATEFYKGLIAKVQKSCGLSEDLLLYTDGSSSPVEPTKLQRCQYACHRFLICLGDLARYRELCRKPDMQKPNWSIAATFYLEATMVSPDSGNPHNQLALLATYVGNDFLALYHCVRSLAVKEPFPDAWDNLVLLFEKSRSSHLHSLEHSLSSETQFDFLKPSERSSLLNKAYTNNGSLNSSKSEAIEHDPSQKPDFWPLFVRMTSFFFTNSRSEDFPSTFACTIRELEVLLALDDKNLDALLESYEQIESVRRGPYRALQVVSILIFVVHSLDSNPKLEPEERNDSHRSTLTQYAWIAALVCGGRLMERCWKCNDANGCPLLAAVLVFVEWLVGMLDKEQAYHADKRFNSALSYIFSAFGDLLNRLDIKEAEVRYPDHSALWEDYELRGFAPVAHIHVSLDFSTTRKHIGYYDGKTLSRVHRLLHAARKIVNTSSESRKWIFLDKVGRKSHADESVSISKKREEVTKFDSGLEIKDSHKWGAVKLEKDIPGGNESRPCLKGESIGPEEEEVILFKPLTRHNSVPIYTSITTNDQLSTEGTSGQTAPYDERLRRATSLFGMENQGPIDPLKNSAAYPMGPPSLSGWVINRESPNGGREKETRDFGEHKLSPIEETSVSLTGLSIGETSGSSNGSGHVSAATHHSSPYEAPVPSAPLLPDNAVWFRGNSSSFSKCGGAMGIKEADGILGSSPARGYSNWHAPNEPLEFSPGVSFDGYPPRLGMSSSEWLYQYMKNRNLERANDHTWPVHFNAPGDLGNFHEHNAPRFDLFDQLGNPLVPNRIGYFESPRMHPVPAEQVREELYLGYQRPNPYGCGTATDLRAEKPPLLQYLKDREWQLQLESQIRGPTYFGN